MCTVPSAMRTQKKKKKKKMHRFVPLSSILENLTAMNSVVKERFASSKVYIFSLIPRRLADPGHLEREFIIKYAIIRLCSEYGHVFLDMRPVFRPSDTGLNLQLLKSKDLRFT